MLHTSSAEILSLLLLAGIARIFEPEFTSPLAGTHVLSFLLLAHTLYLERGSGLSQLPRLFALLLCSSFYTALGPILVRTSSPAVIQCLCVLRLIQL